MRYAASPRAAPMVVAAQQFFKGKVSQFSVRVGAREGWRSLAKLAVRNVGEPALDPLLTVGLFAPGSHELVPAANCPVHHHAINTAISLVQQQARLLKITAYDERTGQGQLRHVVLAVPQRTGAVQLTLVWNGEGPWGESSSSAAATKRDITHLWKALVSSATNENCNDGQGSLVWHSIWIHYNSSWKHANAIFLHTGQWEKLYTGVSNTESCPMGGITEYLEQSSCPVNVPLHFPPQVFRQANLTAFSAIVEAIRGYFLERLYCDLELHHRPRCLELYGGVGTIGLHIADLCESLVSSDENPHNVQCFEASANIVLQKLRERKKADQSVSIPTIQYRPASASTLVESGALHKVNIVIVDPPRKGLEDTVSAALAQATSPQTLIYVSCGFEAFQRDYFILTTGGWKLERAEGHILFPGSDAIETLAFFTR